MEDYRVRRKRFTLDGDNKGKFKGRTIWGERGVVNRVRLSHTRRLDRGTVGVHCLGDVNTRHHCTRGVGVKVTRGG